MFLALAATPGLARADVRGSAGADPRDAPEALSGPRETDIESVRVAYDTAGSLAVTVRLFEPWAATAQSYPNFEVSIGTAPFSGSYGCNVSNPGDASLLGYMDPASSITASLRVASFDGSLPAQRSVSPDGLETTFTVSAPQMSGRNYICASSIGLFRFDPQGHCSPSLSNCQNILYRYNGDRVDEFFFNGFSVRPACDDQLDNDGDGKADVEDPGCRGQAAGTSETDPAAVRSTLRLTSLKATRRCELDIEVEALPDLTPAKLFPFGKVELRVRGIAGHGKGYIKKRRLPLGEALGYGFKLRPGRYRVTGRYLGDRYRLASKTHTRTISVCARKRR